MAGCGQGLREHAATKNAHATIELGDRFSNIDDPAIHSAKTRKRGGVIHPGPGSFEITGPEIGDAPTLHSGAKSTQRPSDAKQEPNRPAIARDDAHRSHAVGPVPNGAEFAIEERVPTTDMRQMADARAGARGLAQEKIFLAPWQRRADADPFGETHRGSTQETSLAGDFDRTDSKEIEAVKVAFRRITLIQPIRAGILNTQGIDLRGRSGD